MSIVDDAIDIVERVPEERRGEFYLACRRAEAGYDPARGSVRAWLTSRSVYATLEHRRRRGGRAARRSVAWRDLPADVEPDLVEQRELAGILARRVQCLPPRAEEVVQLVARSSLRRAARTMGLSVSGVAAQWSEAKDRLKGCQ